MGVVCNKAGFGYTVIDHETMEATDEALDVPNSIRDRGAQLNWVLDEASRAFDRYKPKTVWLQTGGGGQFSASLERHEVEAAVQIAAHQSHVACETKTTEAVRAKWGVAKGRGAYADLMKRPEVAERSNMMKRHQYLYAKAAL